MATPMVKIAGTAYPLKWNLRAKFRAQSLPVPRNPSDFLKDGINISVLLSLAWAALPEIDGIKTPEDLAEIIDAEPGALERLDDAFADAMAIAYPKKDTPADQLKKDAPNSLPVSA